MNSRKNSIVIIGFVISVSLLASSLAVMFVSRRDGRRQFELLNAVCGEAAERDPGTRKIIAAALKEYTRVQRSAPSYGAAENHSFDEDILTALGYRASDFTNPSYRQNVFFAIMGFLAGVTLFLLTFLYRNRKEAVRIRALADYLEQVNMGKAVVLSTSGEDDFSKLEDAIYKNVTYLYQTKDAAVQAKNEFAKNLSNIAHQIKTPIAAMSLSLQMIEQEQKIDCVKQLEKQLLRLTHLQEALLVLSRLDAGVLKLQRRETDVFTLLVLAADNLEELSACSGVSVDIPELKEAAVLVDLDWTMEAVMNLMKNCMEHTRGGSIHCSYEQNTLYTKILIWDDGEGFAKEDIPRLFERFYRGRNAGGDGIGIGLALSKELIERQNGTIRAKNMPGGGACFEIRFYSH